MSERGDEHAARVARTLQDLMRFAEMAARLVDRGRPAYNSDETLRLAAEAILHKIGEAVGRLPEGFINEHAEVPWRAMRATKNLVAHQYDQVDYGIIWNALADRLPHEAELIHAALGELTSRDQE